MIIFLDTNILFNNWHVQNANFKYLFNFLENTNSTLYISEIVCNEVDNKFQSELRDLKKAFSDNIKKANNLLNEKPLFNIEELDVKYSIREVLTENTFSVIFFDYENITNKELVDRAIKKIKPFQNEDKGYRDSLIWLSFLEKIATIKDNEKVAFINNNSSDFYNSEKTDFHEDLKIDIEKYNIIHEFSVFDSLKDFISKEVNLDEHKYTNSKIMEDFIYPYERMIEDSLESFINSQSTTWFNEIIKKSTDKFKQIVYLTNFHFEIEEGIEDPELLSWSKIEENTFFAELSFNLRMVTLSLTFPKQVFFSRTQLFDFGYYDATVNNEFVTINTLQRLNFNISFNYNIDTNTIDDIAVNDLY